MIRKKCREAGTHKFTSYIEMIGSPYVFCARWGCSGCAVSTFCDPRIAEMLHNGIAREDRFPPCEMKDGKVVEEWSM